jgi:death on curing protein
VDEPVWLDRILLEVVHTDQILEHGGSLGIRDEGLLESALARPIHEWSHDSDTDLAALAAACGFGIAKNHPFIDGNKRAALMAIYTFLAINDVELEAPEPEAVSIVLSVADGSAGEDELATWIRSRLIPWTSDRRQVASVTVEPADLGGAHVGDGDPSVREGRGPPDPVEEIGRGALDAADLEAGGLVDVPGVLTPPARNGPPR